MTKTLHSTFFKDDNHESHGPLFHSHMYRINKESKLNITVYHNFHNEVAFYQKHVWRCDGPCRNKAPYFGYVRRSMNRKPSSSDYWFKYHQTSCGGNFLKISEPEKKPGKDVANNSIADSCHDIREYFPSNSKKDDSPKNFAKPVNKSPTKFDFKKVPKPRSPFKPFSGTGHKLGNVGNQQLLPFYLTEKKEKCSKNVEVITID